MHDVGCTRIGVNTNHNDDKLGTGITLFEVCFMSETESLQRGANI